jgi:anti-anti-sigma factor
MNTQILDREGVTIVKLTGDLTGDCRPSLQETVSELISTPRGKVLIDMGGVKYMNSAGLADLVRITAQANTQECRLVLASPSPFVDGVLRTSRLDRFFELFPTTDEALAAMR